MHMRVLSLSIFFFLIVCSGFSQGVQKQDNIPDQVHEMSKNSQASFQGDNFSGSPNGQPEWVKLVKANNSFSVDLFREVVQDRDAKNMFLSPLSVSIALGMTLNGAEKKTKKSIKETLYLQDIDLQEVNEWYPHLFENLRSEDSKVGLEFANSIWIKNDLLVQDEFKEKGEKYYKAKITSLDFSNPTASKQINEWISNNTGGNIENIVASPIPRNTVMYLVNTIYFQGIWENEFEEEATTEKPFILEDSTTTTVDMMRQSSELRSYVSENVKLLDLPYEEAGYKMTLIMPADKKSSIDDFIDKELTTKNIYRWIKNTSTFTTSLEIPKFEIEYQAQMKKILEKMGMTHAFKRGVADFSKINPNEEIFISQVKHKALVEVDEKGTKAAATSSVRMGDSIGISDFKWRKMRFNRPFVVLLRSGRSILFMGKVGNPNWSKDS